MYLYVDGSVSNFFFFFNGGVAPFYVGDGVWMRVMKEIPKKNEKVLSWMFDGVSIH